jgi:hypothetical protein
MPSKRNLRIATLAHVTGRGLDPYKVAVVVVHWTCNRLEPVQCPVLAPLTMLATRPIAPLKERKQ